MTGSHNGGFKSFSGTAELADGGKGLAKIAVEIDMQSTLDKAYKTRELARVQLRALGVLVYLRAAHLFPSRSQRDGVVRVRF